jgi:hypothetical protein
MRRYFIYLNPQSVLLSAFWMRSCVSPNRDFLGYKWLSVGFSIDTAEEHTGMETRATGQIADLYHGWCCKSRKGTTVNAPDAIRLLRYRMKTRSRAYEIEIKSTGQQRQRQQRMGKMEKQAQRANRLVLRPANGSSVKSSEIIGLVALKPPTDFCRRVLARGM